VIGARNGGIPESVEPGLNGLLFEPGDDAALAEQIERLLADRDEVARLSAGALQAVARYAPERIAAAFDTVLTGLTVRRAEPQALQAEGLRT
jgi:glycosyltransferase involved in cell wall biosynthesis